MPSSPPSSNLIFWLKADAGRWTDTGGTTAANSDGDLVARWDDQSGNGNHVTQATGGNRPVLKLAIMNSLPVLRCGVSTGISMATSGSISHGIGTGDFWMAAVWQRTAALGDNAYQTALSIGSFAPAFYGRGQGQESSDFYLGGNHQFATAVVRGGSYLVEMARVSGTVKSYQGSSGAVPVLDANTFSLSNSIGNAAFSVFNDGSNSQLQGDLAEVLLYTTSLNSTDQTTLENYLRAKWWGIGLGPFPHYTRRANVLSGGMIAMGRG